MKFRANSFLVLEALLAFCITTICSNFAVSQSNADKAVSPSDYLEYAKQGIKTLQDWYSTNTGLYKSTGWWNSANAATVLIDYARLSNSQQNYPTLANTFTAAQKTSPGFINRYYDDEGWWALAWIDAYDLTHIPRYLEMAESIFADMAAGWDTTTCGGGIWWSKDKTYKNAIANELFLSVAAHLANRVRASKRSQYADWSKREWKWFSGSGMINKQGLINDGLDSKNPAACKNNGQTTWSYNQGVILAGLAESSRFDDDPTLLPAAISIATSAIAHLTDANGILHDACEPKCGDDGPQFKGIFVRNLARLYKDSPKSEFRTFAQSNARSIWTEAQGPAHMLGLVWSGPFDSGDAAKQSSALDAIIAAAAMSKTP